MFLYQYGYRFAFSNFDAVKISKYTQNHIKKLIQNKAIIRNKLKINNWHRRGIWRRNSKRIWIF